MHVISNKYKNNCLMKSEVGMAVLKSKQTRVASRGNQHIRIIESVDSISRDGPDTPIYI